MSSKPPIVLRLLIASTIGLVVSAIAIVVAWQNEHSVLIAKRQLRTRWALGSAGEAIRAHQRTTGSLPRSLDQVRDVSGLPLVDGWDRPFLYSTDGGGFLLSSYGRDGKPGGIGLDCDLSTRDPWLKESHATLAQFLFELPSEGIIWACAASGILVFFVCLVTTREGLAGRSALDTILTLVVTAATALGASVFIRLLHFSTH